MKHPNIFPYKPHGQLGRLCESFIDAANQPMDFGSLPVKAKEPAPTIVASERWQHLKQPNCMTKSFRFRRPEDRTRFVVELMEYEDATQHHAEMLVTEDAVSLKLVTKDIDEVTESDHEYGKYADALYLDICYQP